MILFFALSMQGQVSDKISKVNIGTAHPAEPLTIQVELVQSNLIERIEIAYRQFGERDFKRSEMILSGNSASLIFPAEIIIPPILEYYFILYIRNQMNPETFPVENAEQQPFRIDIQPRGEGPKEIIILSPEPNESLRQNDVLISFSLVKFDSLLSINSTKIFLDNADLSASMVVAGDLIVLKPENASITLQAGDHIIHVELFDTIGNKIGTYDWNFRVSGLVEKKTTVPVTPWMYGSSIQLETRRENISSTTTPFNRATLNAHGSYEDIRIRGHLYFTNAEQSNRQPQNRYFIGGESPWLKIGYGDSYPVFTDFIMSGKRVRGLTANLTLGKFNLDLTSGAIVRKIEGTVFETFPKDSLYSKQLQYPGGSFDSLKDLGSWARLQYGTFDRKLFAIRTILGKRDESHIGFSYLRAADDTNSIKYGKLPQENVVIGSDILLSFDRRNFDIFGQIGFSATNNDISGGSMSDAEIDSMFDESNRETVRKIRDYVSKIITVNENLIPLGTKHMPTLSYEGGLILNYFNNAFRFMYLRHGKSYESFGSSFFQTDVRGYNISDRLRLLENKILLSGGFERLQDNTDETKAATTTSRTINAGVSYFPRFEFPNVTIAYLLASNNNGLSNLDPVAIDDRTNRIMLQLGKEFKWHIKHNASLNISTSTRDDQTTNNLDTRNTTVALSTASTFNIPLQTMVSLSVNSSKFISSGNTTSTLTYTTVYTNAEYRMMEDRLKLSGSLNSTFGDIQRILFGANAQYYFLEYLSAQTQLSLYFNNKMFGSTAVSNDIIWSFILRADI